MRPPLVSYFTNELMKKIIDWASGNEWLSFEGGVFDRTIFEEKKTKKKNLNQKTLLGQWRSHTRMSENETNNQRVVTTGYLHWLTLHSLGNNNTENNKQQHILAEKTIFAAIMTAMGGKWNDNIKSMEWRDKQEFEVILNSCLYTIRHCLDMFIASAMVTSLDSWSEIPEQTLSRMAWKTMRGEWVLWSGTT